MYIIKSNSYKTNIMTKQTYSDWQMSLFGQGISCHDFAKFDSHNPSGRYVLCFTAADGSSNVIN